MNNIKETFEKQMRINVKSIYQFENLPNNSVYKIETENQSYIFKVYSSRDWPENGKIPFVYRKLSEINIPHPELYVFDREDEIFPNGYLIEECLSGITADKIKLSENETIVLFEKLAKLVSQIHRIKMVNFGYTGDGSPAIWSTFSECMYDILNDNSDNLINNGFFEANELSEINKAVYARLKSCDAFPSVLCHGDLSTKNIIVNSDQITLIDWDDVQSLCWMADIARLTFWMKINYDESDAAIYKKAFLMHYETEYDKNIFYDMEDALHVWYGLDYLMFFKKGDICEKVKKQLEKSRNICGI